VALWVAIPPRAVVHLTAGNADRLMARTPAMEFIDGLYFVARNTLLHTGRNRGEVHEADAHLYGMLA
jgi:hypothetical protein